MTQEDLVTELNDSINEIIDKAGFFRLRTEFENLKDLQDEFGNVKTGGKEAVRQKLSELHEDDEVVANVRIRDGSAYKNKSPSLAGKSELLDAVKQSEHLSEEEFDQVAEALNMADDYLKKSIENKERILMDDDGEFDAVTLKVKGSRLYLKLLRLDGGKNHKMQPLEEVENKHVEELIKFIRYHEEKLELIEEMQNRVQEAIDEREAKLEAVREVESE